eukprot:10104019-Karenia_brevis.AAC.1
MAVSAHAPHSTKPEASAWWDHFLQVLIQYCAGKSVFLGIDANLSVVAADHRSVGTNIRESSRIPKFHDKFMQALAACNM